MQTLPDVEATLLADLERLETGELDASEARAVLRTLVDVRGNDAGPEAYASLRSWIGRLLRGSPDSESLRRWYNLLRATAAQFRGEQFEFGVRIQVLGELVFERAGMAETRRASDILKRRHVSAVLAELVASSGTINRSELKKRLGLEQANLTRVCTLLLDAGLVARREDGRSALFELTTSGLALAKREQVRASHAATAMLEEAEEWQAPADIKVAKEGTTSEVDAYGRYDNYLPLAA